MNKTDTIVAISLIVGLSSGVIYGLYSVGWLEPVGLPNDTKYEIGIGADSILYIGFDDCQKGIMFQNSTGSRICLSQDDLYDMAKYYHSWKLDGTK